MTLFDPPDVSQRGQQYGWREHAYQWSQGKLMIMRKEDCNGDTMQLNIWCTTGTVGSYLTHPRQGKRQLFRREVDSWGDLDGLFRNPRVHTGDGYHRVDDRPPKRTREAPSVPCPGCGKMCRSRSGVAGHFESGACSSCPGRENAMQVAYREVSRLEHNTGSQGMFTGQKMLTGCVQLDAYGEIDYGHGYQAGGTNYSCPGCQKGFRTSQALLAHCEAKPECRSDGQHWRALGY